MSKVIELTQYRNDKFSKHCNNQRTNEPPWFYELNEGIKNLAYKNMDTIIKHIQENLMEAYYNLLKYEHPSSEYFSIDCYITEYLNLIDPFTIDHDIQFNRGNPLKIISHNDWMNITDIIIRMGIIIYYDLWDGPIEAFHFTHQYCWTSIKVEIYNES